LDEEMKATGMIGICVLMVMFTFRTLIAIDKVDGLSITKEEATSLLPIVQDIISKGELSDDSKSKLTAKLSADQKKYVDNAAANVPGRAQQQCQRQSGCETERRHRRCARHCKSRRGRRRCQGAASIERCRRQPAA
jgi:hypothetical protein